MSRTAKALADLHARCFTTPRPWTADEFDDLLRQPNVVLIDIPEGFAMARIAADEAELLTIAIDPNYRGKGFGRQLLMNLETSVATRGASVMILEVAEDNAAARALYDASGYADIARRPRYYSRPDGQFVGAIVMRRALT